MHGEMRLLAEKVKDAEQERILKMEADKVAMLKKLKLAEETKANMEKVPQYYLNKRQKKQLEKIRRDPDLTEEQKKTQTAEIEKKRVLIESKEKRGSKDCFKSTTFYMGGDRPTEGDVNMHGTITNGTTENKSLWTENEAAFLEDVTMNLVPDDACLAVKGKTVMKWDTTKKRYTLQKVDRDGKVMKERRNESGKIIKEGDKKIDPTAIYKQWQKKTHLSLQRPGEREDKKMLAQA